jgi:hypothetical protein
MFDNESFLIEMVESFHIFVGVIFHPNGCGQLLSGESPNLKCLKNLVSNGHG